MSAGRRNRGFAQAGRLRSDQLGLPAARAKQLVLAHAWTGVAGEAVARRAPALRVIRGILEIQAPDDRWAETLAELIPRLAGRLATSHPELGVRKFRLLREGVAAASGPEPVPDVVDEGAESDAALAATGKSAPAAGSPASSAERPIAPADRLRDLVDRYLEVGGKKRRAASQKP